MLGSEVGGEYLASSRLSEGRNEDTAMFGLTYKGRTKLPRPLIEG